MPELDWKGIRGHLAKQEPFPDGVRWIQIVIPKNLAELTLEERLSLESQAAIRGYIVGTPYATTGGIWIGYRQRPTPTNLAMLALAWRADLEEAERQRQLGQAGIAEECKLRAAIRHDSICKTMERDWLDSIILGHEIVRRDGRTLSIEKTTDPARVVAVDPFA